MKNPRLLLAPTLALPGSLFYAILAVSGSPLDAQTVRTWNGATGGAWLTTASWSPSGTFAGNTPNAVVTGEGAATDIMAVTAANAATNVGINMNTLGGLLSLGGIDFNKTSTATLQIGNSSTTTNGILLLNGATLNSVPKTLIRVSGSANLTIANVNSGTGTQTMGLQLGITDGIFDVDTSRSLTVSSIISEATANSGFTKTGAGELRLNGANTFTGAINVSGGNLTIANYAGLDANSSTITVSGGTAGLQIAQVGTGSTTDSYAQNLSLNGFLRTIGGSGTNLLTLTWNGNITLAGNSTITNNGNSAIIVAGGVNLGAHTLTFQTDRTGSRINGAISGTGGITKTSPQDLALNGANTYTGATTISGGVLFLGNVNALANTNGISMAGGTRLAPTLTGVVINAPITVGAAATTVTISAPNVGSQDFTAGVLTIASAIGGDGNVAFNSTQNTNNLNNILLTAQSNYAGSTLMDTTAQVAAGGSSNHQFVIRLGIDNALPTTTVLTIDGKGGNGTGRVIEFVMNGFDQTLAGLNNVARDSRVQRVVNSNASDASTLTINGSVDSTYGGAIGVNPGVSGFGPNSMAQVNFPSGTNGNNILLTKAGTGTFTLTGANTFSGRTLISGGILSVGNSSALSQSPLDTTNSIVGSATDGLRATVTTLTLGGLTGNKNLADVFTTTSGGYDTVSALTLNPVSGASHSYSGVIADGAAGMTLTKTGAGTQTLSAANTYTGGTTVNAGTLTAGHVNAFGSGNITVNSAGTLNLGGFAVGNTITNTDGTITGASGSATITQSGGTINGSLGGTVTASGTVAGSPTFTGTLKGTATFSGAVTLADGSVHAPGNSPGSQTFESGLSYDGLSTLEWDFVGDTLLTPGTDFDAVLVTGGDLTITSGATLKLIASTVNYASADWDTVRVFSVVDFTSTGASTGVFTNLNLSLAGSFGPQGGWSVANTGGDILLTWTPVVPEPSTYAALAGLAVLGLAWKRRRHPGSLR